MLKWIKTLYTLPSVENVAQRELDEARRKLLEAQSSRDYAQSMCMFYSTKVDRLTAYLATGDHHA